MNPLSILSTAARSTTCFSNLFLSIALLGAASGRSLTSLRISTWKELTATTFNIGTVVSATCAFSFAMHLSMPVILLPPLILLLSRAQKDSIVRPERNDLYGHRSDLSPSLPLLSKSSLSSSSIRDHFCLHHGYIPTRGTSCAHTLPRTSYSYCLRRSRLTGSRYAA